MNDTTKLPDGSAFFTASMPLPEDHWLYEEKDNIPPMVLQCGTENPYREKMVRAIREGVRYAIRTATMNGQDNDFDPDALVQQAVIGIAGYYTPDGTLNTFNGAVKSTTPDEEEKDT